MYQHYKFKMLSKILVIFLFILAFMVYISKKIIVFNVSPSSPIGIYLKVPYKKINKGDYIVYKIPEEYTKYADERLKTLLTVKKVIAIEGDLIENKNNNLYINHELKGEILKNIPTKIKNKVIIKKDEYLTISDNLNSLDGRYYGTLNKKDIIEKVILIKEMKFNE